MTAPKIRLGILFGGKSAEHEVSLISAQSIISALNPNKYEISLIAIDKNGEWHLRDGQGYLEHVDNPKLVHLHGTYENIALIPKNAHPTLTTYSKQHLQRSLELDVIFPVLHGPFGEDGTVQGLLKLADIPFVGAGVLGSAVGMDKDVMKRLLRDAGLPIAKFLVVHSHEVAQFPFEEVAKALGLPLFIKPANLGSSVGISKVHTVQEYKSALSKAFSYDRKILIEECVTGREIECAVLGNEEPVASLPGELIPTHDFYSYEAKYIDEKGAAFEIPVSLPAPLTEKLQAMAIQTFKVLCCEGMARVDFFLKSNGELLINEINTIPGFTKVSMYPKLWAASGLAYPDLLDRLIQLALERHAQEKVLGSEKEVSL